MKRSALLLLLLLLAACSRGPSLRDQLTERLSSLSNTAELGTVEYTVRKAVRARDEGEWFKIGNRRILFSCTAHIKATRPTTTAQRAKSTNALLFI